jgi:hypothetical protein
MSNNTNNTLDLSGNIILDISSNNTHLQEEHINLEMNQSTQINNTTTLLENNIIDSIPHSIIDSTLNLSCKEFVIFKNELESLIKNNLYILKECKSNKRLLDIKYAELNRKINYIQISVIVFSTLSGFLQSTKEYFKTPEPIVSVTGISISTYISLILSVSKYYKFDEKKEAIHNLREKYGNLHNKIEFRMDILGPYTNYKLWEHQDPVAKLEEWNKIKISMEEEYITLVETKQALTTEFESIMDSKSRNKNYIRDRELVLGNRKKLVNTLKSHKILEESISHQQLPTTFDSIIQLPDDDLNNWDDPV